MGDGSKNLGRGIPPIPVQKWQYLFSLGLMRLRYHFTLNTQSISDKMKEEPFVSTVLTASCQLAVQHFLESLGLFDLIKV